MDTYHQTNGYAPDALCKVRISDGSIAVSYDEEGVGVITYEGPEVEPGHFRLNAPAVDGQATLHRFQNSNVLEGWWHQGGARGMWRITLSD